MGSVVPPIILLLKLSVFGLVFTVQGSAGNIISPAPAEAFPIERTLSPKKSPVISNAPSSGPQPNVSDTLPPSAAALPPLLAPPVIPIVSPPLNTSQPPQIPGFSPSSPVIPSVSPPLVTPPSPENGGLVPSPPPIIPIVSPPLITAPPPQNTGLVPSPPINPIASPPLITTPPPPPPVIPIVSPPVSLAPPPLITIPPPPSPIAPVVSPPVPEPPAEPNVTQRKAPPVSQAPLPVPVVSPPTNSSSPPEPSPTIKPTPPEMPPFRGTPKPVSDTPAASPASNSGWSQPPAHPIAPAIKPPVTPVPTVSPTRESPRSSPPLAPPPFKTLKHLPPSSHSPAKGSFSAVAPSPHDSPVPVSPSPKSSPFEGFPSPKSSPASPSHKQSHGKAKTSSPAPTLSPPSSDHQGPIVSPPSVPTSKRKHYAPPSLSPGSQHPIPKPVINVSPSPSPSPEETPGWTKMPILPPKATPTGSSAKSPKVPFLPPIHTLPPPPPNEDCSSTVCMDPFTNTPPGSPCSCVLPMQVGLQLNVALYTFFPLVSELAREIAAGVFMNPSQVRIMGANAASQEPEKTIVLIDLVPLGKRFDNTTAFLTSQRFWLKKVAIKASYFGDYKVLYVRYPGLPPSPPSADSGISIIDDGPYSGNNNNGRTIKPLGVDVGKGHQKNRLGAGAIAVIALSAAVLVVLCSAAAWVFVVRNRGCFSQQKPTPPPLPASTTKPSGTTGSMVGSAMSSASLSFGSSIPPYTGSAKTFNSLDIERATNNFDDSRILGEGGFGLVYSGILEDGTHVAVKVLKRDDHQGGREFLAEVEMLSRLHHRNLVKLIGICTEERNRCLVYELIPNGSVESHLHGVDKESAPLDWDARIKIALGAARGLAYLHEDSSPRVIHRDFKSSNILLEHDFTPKVSDFGLARTALDEENRHISTRVMGTFGYVAPEYAMTGHLLVKSDVYSYGVVLLELLTGRKPVDMSQPPGQENLVAWARPLLTSKEGLQMIVDPSLGPEVPFDSVAKVAAIASMCVQPEVSHRPFMGEVVQALKLICNECDEAREVGSSCSSRDSEAEVDADVAAHGSSVENVDGFQNPVYDSEMDIERGLSVSDLFGSSVRAGGRGEGSFRRYSSSGPLDRGRGVDLWQRIRRLRGGSASEHGVFFRLWPNSN